MLAPSSQVTHTDYISQVLCLKQASSSTLCVKCLQRPWVSLKILRFGNPSDQSPSLAPSVHRFQQAVKCLWATSVSHRGNCHKWQKSSNSQAGKKCTEWLCTSPCSLTQGHSYRLEHNQAWTQHCYGRFLEELPLKQTVRGISLSRPWWPWAVEDTDVEEMLSSFNSLEKLWNTWENWRSIFLLGKDGRPTRYFNDKKIYRSRGCNA